MAARDGRADRRPDRGCSLVGVAAATARAAEAGVAPLPVYVGCDARALPFPDHSIDAFISIDVLQLIPDRELVFQEVARVLRPGGALAFSSWERTAGDESVPPRMRRVPRDYTELVGRNYLRMNALEISEKSHQRSEAFWANVTASADEVRSELGEEVASEILDEASHMDIFLASTRRVLCVARSSS
ncbi:MAG: class I SAM-dependent methyltransferase [Candidatus Dormiibacterota bacterium]